MVDVATLGIRVDDSNVADATETLNRLAEAAQRAKAALDSLAGEPHSGITVKVVGTVALVEIAPTGHGK